MRYMMIALALMFPTAAAAMPDSSWTCTYSEPPDWSITYKLQFISGRLIIEKHDGTKRLIKDAVLTDRYGFWEDPDQNEFYPQEKKLVNGKNKDQRIYTCVIHP